MKKSLPVGIIAIVVAALTVILCSIFIFKNNLENRMTEDIYRRLGELSVNNAASISNKVEDQLEMMYTLASYLEKEDLRGERVLSLLKKTVESYGFLRCAITFPDGSFVTHDGKNDGNASEDEYVIKGFQGISTVTGPRGAVVDPSVTVILLTVPIYEEGQITAVLTCTYETQYLNRVFQMTSFQGQGYSYITDETGAIISGPGIEGTIYRGNNIMEFFASEFADHTKYESIEQSIQARQAGAVSWRMNGAEKYISYQPLGINNWYVFSVTSGEVLEQQLHNTLRNVYLLSAIIVVIFLMLTGAVTLLIVHLQRSARLELQRLAYYDDLTGISNKNRFERESRRILDTAPGKYAYIILNVNKFKMINDVFGFPQGDDLLRHIATTITREAAEDEICARFDADNFHILSLYLGKTEIEERMMEVAKQIGIFEFDKSVPHMLSVGFGIYVIEDKTLPVNLMGDRARMALSKIKGIHSYATYFYDNTIIDQFIQEQEIENRMEYALQAGEMQLFLQPKYQVDTQKIHGAEALVRWQSPVRGLIMPDQFIPLFERNGFIIKLDLYMVESTCKILRRWQDAGLPVVPISVNQTRQCLYCGDYFQKLLAILDTYKIDPSLIELEITERAFFEDEDALIRIVEQMHVYGFLVAMDDFGAGYSSLNMLQDVIVDVLKIDKNFFRESINSQRGKKIVQSIVAMANDLDIEVVAEGIETGEQLAFLEEIRCGAVQGFYFSKAVPVDAFEKLLAQDRDPSHPHEKEV